MKTDQPTRLEVTQADREAAAAWLRERGFPSCFPEADLIEKGEWDHHSAVQVLVAHRLAHTVPGDAGLRAHLDAMMAATLPVMKAVAEGRIDQTKFGHVFIDLANARIEASAALSTSPVIDTNEGLAERVRVKIAIHADDTTYLTETVSKAELALLQRLQERSRSECPDYGGQITLEIIE